MFFIDAQPMIVKVRSPSIMSLRQLDVLVVPYELPVVNSGHPQKQASPGYVIPIYIQGKKGKEKLGATFCNEKEFLAGSSIYAN